MLKKPEVKKPPPQISAGRLDAITARFGEPPAAADDITAWDPPPKPAPAPAVEEPPPRIPTPPPRVPTPPPPPPPIIELQPVEPEEIAPAPEYVAERRGSPEPDEPSTRPASAVPAKRVLQEDLDTHVTDPSVWAGSVSYSRTLLRSASRIRRQSQVGSMLRQLEMTTPVTHPQLEALEAGQRSPGRTSPRSISPRSLSRPTSSDPKNRDKKFSDEQVTMGGLASQAKLMPLDTYGMPIAGGALSGANIPGSLPSSLPMTPGGIMSQRAMGTPASCYEASRPTTAADYSGRCAWTDGGAARPSTAVGLLSGEEPITIDPFARPPDNISPPKRKHRDRLAAQVLVDRPVTAACDGGQQMMQQSPSQEVIRKSCRAMTPASEGRPTTSASTVRFNISPREQMMMKSASTPALQTKLLDLTYDLLPCPVPTGYNTTSKLSRQSNHLAFSPLNTGGNSPALLPLRRTQTQTRLRGSDTLLNKPLAPRPSMAGDVKFFDDPQRVPPPLSANQRALARAREQNLRPNTPSRDSLTRWAMRYMGE